MKSFQTTESPRRAGRRLHVSALLVVALVAFSALACAAAYRAGDVGSPAVATAAEPIAEPVQTAITGEWTAELRRDKPGEINFTFHRRYEKGGFSMSGDSLPLSELQGLSADTASSAKANVNFSIVREAGTFQCDGYFREGRGAGFWTLSINQNFVSAMRSRGYNGLTDEDLLRAALHNLTTKYVDDMKAAGYDHLTFEELRRGVSHEVTLQFIREMQGAGYPGLTMEELVRARNHDVNAEYVREVRAMGFDKQPLETLIRMRNHEITREFIARMRTAGFDNLSVEELIRLKNHDITPEFVNEVKAEGYAQISAETAVRLKNHNVDRDYIRRVKAKGFTNLSLEDIIRLRNNDIVK